MALAKNNLEDFPGGPMVKNLPANAGYTDLIPALERFHMPMRHLSPWATTTKAWMPRACAQQQRVAPLTTSRESLLSAIKTQHSQK